MKDRVFIVSPYRGKIMRNVAYASAAVRDSFERQEAPFAGHLFYTTILDDADSKQRVLGMTAAHSFMASSHRVAVYTDLGMTEGMVSDVNAALDMKLPMVFRRLPNWAPPSYPWNAEQNISNVLKLLEEARTLAARLSRHVDLEDIQMTDHDRTKLRLWAEQERQG